MALIKDDKIRFFITWILLSTFLIPLGAILGFIAGSGVHGVFGFGYDDVGTPLSQTIVYCTWIAIMGAVISLKQWFLLRNKFGVSFLLTVNVYSGVV